MPLLSFGPAVLLVLGVALALFRVRHQQLPPAPALVPGHGYDGGMLVIESPQSHRLVTAVPRPGRPGGHRPGNAGNLVQAALRRPDAPPSADRCKPVVAFRLAITAARTGMALLALVLLFTLNDLWFYWPFFPPTTSLPTPIRKSLMNWQPIFQ